MNDELRIPPQHIESEQAVLGGIMLAPKAWDDVADLLTEDSFYRRDHALIWRAIKALRAKNKPTDAVTVGEFLDARGLGDQVRGGSYLIELASTTPSAANIRAYAGIVADRYRLRELADTATNVLENCYTPDGRDSVEIIGNAQIAISNLLRSQPCDLEDIDTVLDAAFADLDDLQTKGGGIGGTPCGFTDLDELLNGLAPGLYILAARPKMGKTTLAQNIAEYIALFRKRAVAMFSLEMTPKAMANRMFSSIGDVDANKLRKGALDDEDWARVSDARRRLRQAPIHISRPQNARVEQIIAQAKRLHAKTKAKDGLGLGLVIVDYLQLIAMPTGGSSNRATDMGDVTRALVLAAHEMGVPILLLSQLNRKLEERTDKRPIPADLRDSGAIEQDADAVIFIYRDEVYHKGSRFAGTAEIIVALQRSGPPGEVRLRYKPNRYRFENLPWDWEPEPLAPRPKKGDKTKGEAFPDSGRDKAAGQ